MRHLVTATLDDWSKWIIAHLGSIQQNSFKLIADAAGIAAPQYDLLRELLSNLVQMGFVQELRDPESQFQLEEGESDRTETVNSPNNAFYALTSLGFVWKKRNLDNGKAEEEANKAP